MGETLTRSEAGRASQILDAHRRWLENGRTGEAPRPDFDFSGMDLSGAILDRAELTGCRFAAAKLTGASLVGANLSGTTLANADLARANLVEAKLDHADLENARVGGADFHRADLTGTNLRHVHGLERAVGLETVIARADSADALHVHACRPSFLQACLGWDQLRFVKRLQLLAGALVVFIPVLFYALEVYNEEVETIRHWARIHGGGISQMLRDWLHPAPVPAQSFLLLLSTLLLLAGSVIYVLACPARIKEFSREQWCNQLNRPLLQYWPLSWKYPGLRLACALCCGLGSAGLVWVLLVQLCRAAMFIIAASSFSLF